MKWYYDKLLKLINSIIAENEIYMLQENVHMLRSRGFQKNMGGGGGGL